MSRRCRRSTWLWNRSWRSARDDGGRRWKRWGMGAWHSVERATDISHSTIARGIHELKSSPSLGPARTRRPGGGRTRATDKDPRLLADLDARVEPTSAGDPECPLRWTTQSVRRLLDELRRMGHDVSHRLWWRNCCTAAATACKRAAKHARAQHLPIAMRSSATSTIGCGLLTSTTSPPYRRRKEEGVGGRFQERRARLATEG